MADVIDPSSDPYYITYRVDQRVTSSGGRDIHVLASMHLQYDFGSGTPTAITAQDAVDAVKALAESVCASLGVATPVDITVYEDRPNTETVTVP